MTKDEIDRKYMELLVVIDKQYRLSELYVARKAIVNFPEVYNENVGKIHIIKQKRVKSNGEN